jgi:putative phosphotransacetylase
VDVIGPKGVLKRVRILGPVRKETQVELAQTDCRNIGVSAPVRSSGDLAGTPGITLKGPNGEITIDHGVIIADRHIHLSESEAVLYGLRDGDRVSVEIDGEKSGIMGGVLIRAGEKHRKDFHIDTDDGNAFQLKQGQMVRILGKEEE